MKTRERLIDVATSLFAARGYDGVSVRDITAAAGTNLGAVTYHFGSKAALFGEVIEREIRPLVAHGKEIEKSTDEPAEKLRRMLALYAMYVMHQEPQLKLLFAESLAGGRRLPPGAREAVAYRNELFAEIVREGIARGDFRECDVGCACWSFFGMLSAYILFQPLLGMEDRKGGYDEGFVKRVVSTATEIFLNGLRSRKADEKG